MSLPMETITIQALSELKPGSYIFALTPGQDNDAFKQWVADLTPEGVDGVFVREPLTAESVVELP